MKTVHKYTLELTDYCTIYAPMGAQFLEVGFQFGVPVVWALVDKDEQKVVAYTLRIAGTGHEIDETYVDYIGQLKLEALHFHVFEVL